ncbi:DUF6950 family protein [Candidatus Halocynthiibacter alkanivorans]|uniref:DUF6950 family protein n=1 Tax=Candidatus Halocynthiibacter alkanivorans TaxID=2267619 RepID=UPI000DF3CF6C|nr:hypothetical protein [Candidatus Halocynthiibacter alkanivorans]
MGKIAGWERLLLDELACWQGVQFIWGRTDCLSMCIACERAVTGESRFAGLPHYSSEFGALLGLKRLGHSSVEDLVSATLPGISVLAAGRGDWVMRDTDALAPGAFGVVVGRNAAFLSESGLIYLPAQSVRLAWSIS